MGAALAVVATFPAAALDPAKALSQYGHRFWSIDDGLPVSGVVAIAQTAEGYLWLGTSEGLARFDGLRFQPWDRRNTPQLVNHDIRAVAASKDGSLWVGTLGGLYRLRAGRLAAVDGPGGKPFGVISALLEDPDGTLWVGTQGDGVIAVAEDRFRAWTHAEGLPNNIVWGLHRDRSGRLWIGCRNGLARLDGNRLQNLTGSPGLIPGSISAFAESPGEGLILGGRWGLCRYQDGRFEPFGEGRPAPFPRVFGLVFDRDGNLWVGGDSGLARHQRGRWDAIDTDRGLTGRLPRALLEDREGALWIGTDDGGIEQLIDTRLVVYGVPEGLPDDVVTTVLEDHLGRVWLGTLKGLARLDGDRVTVWAEQDGLSFSSVTDLAEGLDGTLWVGTTGGLNAFDGTRFRTYRVADGLPLDDIDVLHVDPKGRLWIGTERGLTVFDQGRFTTFDLPCPFLNVIADHRAGGLWLGANGGGLMHFRDGEVRTWAEAEGLTSGNVMALVEDARGVVWFSTQGGGLYRLHGETLTRFSTEDGLYDDVGWQLLEDLEHRLWVISSRGIFRIVKEELDALAEGRHQRLSSTVLGRSDGLRDLRGTGAGIRTRDGRLWFTTTAGVAVIDPARLVPDPTPINAVIEALLIDGQPVAAAKLAEPGPIRLPAGVRRVEVRYTALTLRAPERVRFAVQLRGFDPRPVEVDQVRSATYTNLRPGTYTLAIAAARDDVALPAARELLCFELAPHFYQTAWFLGLTTLALALAAVSLYRLRLRALALRYEAVLAERTRIARDLHDTLAQDLIAAVLTLGRTLKDAGHQAPGLRASLEHCRDLLQGSLEAARRSVASLRRPLEQSTGLAASLEQLAEEARRSTPARIVVEVTSPPPPLSGEINEGLLGVAREALHNAVRHASAEKIRVGLHNGDQRVRLQVVDDGMGFVVPATDLDGHYGLLGMRERAAAIGAEVTIASTPGHGTTVEVTLRRPGRLP